MVQCERCSKDHDGAFGAGRFCSKICARAFSTSKNRKQISEKVSLTLWKPRNCTRCKNPVPLQWGYKNCPDCRSRLRQYKDWRVMPFEELNTRWTKKKRLIHERGHVCWKCNLSEWLGKPITLELEHIDGDNKNDSRENLEILCPNCHSQTSTWKWRNVTKRRLQRKAEEVTT